MLAAILTPTWWNERNSQLFTEVLTQWDELIANYQMASGEKVTDGMKTATMLAHAPIGIRTFLQTCPRDLRQDQAAMRKAIWEHVLGGRAAGAAVIPQRYKDQESTPMEVDALTGDKCNICGRAGHWAKDCWFKDTSGKSGKGSSSAKGKDNGKGKAHSKDGVKGKTGKSSSVAWSSGGTAAFAGKCGYCGITGHKKIDCRKRIKEESNKPGGAVKAVAGEPSVAAITEYYAYAEDDEDERKDFC